jgi:GNAT superfamily N-acetyltransferase
MNTNPKFLEQILLLEAQKILKDIENFTCLQSLIRDFDKEKRMAAIQYIRDVFYECYELGQLKIHTESEGELLKGYALIILFPQFNSLYLHSLFVVEDFRGKGLGRKLLNNLKKHQLDTCLICDHTKIQFYEHLGFRTLGKAAPPVADNFRVSKYLYHSLSIMSDSQNSKQTPIFYLNDNDLKIIAGCSDEYFAEMSYDNFELPTDITHKI